MFAAGKTSSGLVAQTYVDDVFSTYLYTGNSTTGGTQTITTNVNLSTYGGMVWIKGRSAASDHILTDTVRGAGTSATASKALSSDLTSAENLGGSSYDYLSAFSTTGFTVKQGGTTAATRGTNYNAVTYAAWTFRKAAKFFDVVTYTGNGSTPRSISHSLGSVPGFIAIKRTDSADNWICRHRSLGDTPNDMTNYTPNDRVFLNLTNAAVGSSNIKADSTTFSVAHTGDLNTNGATYVAYLFAHDTATDGLIQCGSFTGNGSATGPTVTLGWEPQFLLVKKTSSATNSNWIMLDVMRGMPVGSDTPWLKPNDYVAEAIPGGVLVRPTATGFALATTNVEVNENAQTFIYLAIRRPNKPPTSGAQVFAVEAWTGSNTDSVERFNSTFSSDVVLSRNRTNNIGANTGANPPTYMTAKLAGAGVGMSTMFVNAETDFQGTFTFLNRSIVFPNANPPFNINSDTFVGYSFRRAPGVFDVVCYTGTGSNTTQAHNLGAIPELIIVKRRGASGAWSVYSAGLSNTEYLVLNDTAAKATGTTYWNSTTPTASVFSLGTAADVNASSASNTYVAYLFASAAGISKVFSYTGNGSSQTINCGFSGGARFVLIKRTDNTGDWYVWDSARGIVAGNDPHLSLNSTAAEVTTDDSVDTDNSGFIVNQLSATNINVTSATYIGLAFA